MAVYNPTYFDYVGDAVTVQFPINFHYILESEVYVTVDHTPVPFSIASGFAVLETAPEQDAEVRVFRSTDVRDPKHVFQHGSPLLPGPLDENFRQTLYAVEEAVQTAGDALSVVDNANQNAAEALDTANQALLDSATAVQTAEGADLKADQALLESAQAVQTAGDADSKADQALITAGAADTKSDNAVLTAAYASSTANSIAGQATAALTQSNEAIQRVGAVEDLVGDIVDGGVARWNGRTGEVYPETGDYSLAMINGWDDAKEKIDNALEAKLGPEDVGTTDGTVAAGDDSRIVNALQPDRIVQVLGADSSKVMSQAAVTAALRDDSRIVNALQPDRIVQGLGTDSTKVMSQAAVTAALSGQQASTDTYQGWYGTVWNTLTDSYIRIGAGGFTSIQSQMKRCVLNADGTVRYFLHPDNSTFKEDGSVAVIDGSEGNVMVQIPKFYCQITDDGVLKTIKISLDPADGFPVHPAFVKAGVEVPFRYYRAYTATIVAGKLISRSGATPTRSTTFPNFRIAARANGAGWELVDWHLYNAVCSLIFTEFRDMRADLYLGRGNDAGQDYDTLTGQSNLIGNGSSPSTNHNMWMSYRGIENFYADCWECIDGINFQNRQAYVCSDHTQFASDVFAGAYAPKGPVWVAGSGTYVRDYQFSPDGFFPIATAGGGSAVAAGDGLWNDSGNRVLYAGGHAHSGALGGALCFNANSAASISAVIVGAGVSF